MAEFISSEKVPKSKILIMIFIKHTLACFMLTKSSRWNRVFIYLIIYCYPERTGNFQEVIYMQLVPFKPFCREIGMFEKKMENLWKNFFDETSFAKPFTEKWVPTVDVSDT